MFSTQKSSNIHKPLRRQPLYKDQFCWTSAADFIEGTTVYDIKICFLGNYRLWRHGTEGGGDGTYGCRGDVHYDVRHHQVHVVTFALGGTAVQVDLYRVQDL